MEFLHLCAESVSDDMAAPGWTPELRQLRDRFLAGGLMALSDLARAEDWLQFGLRPSVAGQRRDLYGADMYAAMEGLARNVLGNGLAKDFFFMHKPPGIQMRIQARTGGIVEIREMLVDKISDWVSSGLIAEFQYGVYEPENYLFGGPALMEWVHRLFTADSRVWLGHHSRTGQQTQASPEPASWALSLIMIKGMLAALGVSGWEKIDVWDRIRRAGRSLGERSRSDTGVAQLASALRQGWSDTERLVASLAPSSRALVLDHRTAVQRLGAEWRHGYFESADASIGPREAAALVIIFHWNRAGLSPLLQAVIAEALADRKNGVPR
ncbi:MULTISPECIES: thiopeptide-type bacteriocin biosynthesis protein [unclassified Streptomyces]|uniref:thiopeptide-type bacteriocin biosynthesis protein n=1 Tax=unclassified Streptomyces TaxID=2593676 RepID=UPI0013011F24|nr:thiopeptide-type bacteriocin biosynthesis protein [Streptomyces sp. TSRI0281]